MTETTPIAAKKIVVYDLETLINLFTACFYDVDTGKKKEFIVFNDINSFVDLVKFLIQLKKHGYTMLGFNVINFDAQIIEYILANYKKWFKAGTDVEDIVKLIYNKAQVLINLPEEERFNVLLPEWKMSIPQIDLFKQKHYDGKGKMGTSLKWIQFTTRYPNIEEMPIPHDVPVEHNEIVPIMGYNWNDVDSTYSFFKKIEFETDLRKTLTEKYNINLINASEPKIAKDVFGKFLSEEMNITYAELKKMRTFRRNIRVNDIIFPYVKFNSPELNVVLNSFRKLNLNPNEKMEFKYEFNYGGIDTVLGLGGIHACCSSGRYKGDGYFNDSDKSKPPVWVQFEGRKGNIVMHDIDVVSFYPNLSIENDLKPAHLGDIFLKVYKQIFEERKKIPKKDPINYIYKIILNSTYGLSNEKNSYLYDPQFTMGITINGQLSILMLVEMLVHRIPDLKIYQENTDGVTIGYDKMYADEVKKIMTEWKAATKLELEEAYYKEMIINDVNNYIGIMPDGKSKKKGLFETQLDFHKNPSFLVIPLALEAYFVNGTPFREFIQKHTDIYDFCGAVKRKATFELNLYKMSGGTVIVEPQQKVTRFFVSKGGGRLVKDFNDGRKAKQTAVLAKWLVTPLNKVVEEEIPKHFEDINYAFYISETEKVITSIEGDRAQQTLF